MSPATTAASPGPWTKCSIKVLVHNFRRNMSAPAWRWLWHCMCQSRVIFRKWSLPVFISQGRILYTKIWKPSCGAVREFINTWFQSYIKSNVIAQYSMVILMSQRSWRSGGEGSPMITNVITSSFRPCSIDGIVKSVDILYLEVASRYRVSHKSVFTLFSLFSQVLEHIQMNFL